LRRFFTFIPKLQPKKLIKMASKFIIRKRQNKILYLEIFIAVGIVCLLSINYYRVHPAIALIIGIVAVLLLISLFFANKIFRYTFSILFSFIWGTAAFLAGQYLEKTSDTTAWVLAVLAFGISLWAHKDHFSFLKSAKLYEYERQ